MLAASSILSQDSCVCWRGRSALPTPESRLSRPGFVTCSIHRGLRPENRPSFGKNLPLSSKGRVAVGAWPIRHHLAIAE